MLPLVNLTLRIIFSEIWVKIQMFSWRYCTGKSPRIVGHAVQISMCKTYCGLDKPHCDIDLCRHWLGYVSKPLTEQILTFHQYGSVSGAHPVEWSDCTENIITIVRKLYFNKLHCLRVDVGLLHGTISINYAFANSVHHHCIYAYSVNMLFTGYIIVLRVGRRWGWVQAHM